MANVTVNIQGNAGSSGGGNGGGGNQNQPTPPSSNPPTGGGTTPSSSPVQPPDSRLVEEVRRAIIQQGAVFVPGNNTYKPIIQQAEQVQREQLNADITQKYDTRRADAQTRMSAEYDRIDKTIDESKKRALEGITDANEKRRIEDLWENKREAEFQRVGSAFDIENENINKEENQERQQSNEDLTKVIRDLTDEIRRNGGNLNPNSFLSQLRQERQKAIVERDTAEDEETSRAAAARVREIDSQINDVVNGKKEEPKIDYGLRTIQTMMGFDQIVRGIANKDLGSMIMGGGQTLTSMFGMSDKAAAKSLAFLKPLATVGTLFTQEAQKSDQMAGLAALIRGDASIEDTRQRMYQDMWDYSPYGGGYASIYDMGLSVPEFAQSSERRIKQRGTAQGGVKESYLQEALERVFSLSSGSLGEAGKFDRYGVNATDAISNLVERLSRVQNSGISQGNYVRVQEYLGMQQDLMSQYMRFQDKPSYGAANRDIEAFAKLKNYTVDSRTSGDIKTVQNQLINPQNDRMKAVLYSTVEEMFPETRGRTDLIDQYLHDPQKMGMINRGNMQKLTNMYGGYDTPMGYWMIQSQLQGIESPERRKSIWEGITKGQAGATLADAQTFQGSNKDEYALQVKNYTSELTQGLITLSDGVYSGVSVLENIVTDLQKVITGQNNFFDYLKSKVF